MAKKTQAETASLYLGCFSADSFGKKEKSSTFQVVVEAASPEAALDCCEQRIASLEKELFTEPTTIYLLGLLQLGGSLEKGVLVNYESGPASTWTVGSLLPQSMKGVTGFGWHDNEGKKGAKNKAMHPFLELGAKPAPKKKAAKKKTAAKKKAK